MWNCANCGEQIEDNFEACWNCQTERGGVSSQSSFSPPVSRQQRALRDRISSQKTAVLKKMVTGDSGDYRDEAIEFAKAELRNRGVPLDAGSTPPSNVPSPSLDVPADRTNARTDRVLDRYTDAYRIARFLVTLGTLIKIVGGLLGALIAFTFFSFGAYVSSANMGRPPNDSAEALLLIVSLLWGAGVFTVFFIAGVIISAQGQILKANLDAAVHTSPFVNDDQKAQIMSLD